MGKKNKSGNKGSKIKELLKSIAPSAEKSVPKSQDQTHRNRNRHTGRNPTPPSKDSLDYLEHDVCGKSKVIKNIQITMDSSPNEFIVPGSRRTQYSYKYYEQFSPRCQNNESPSVFSNIPYHHRASVQHNSVSEREKLYEITISNNINHRHRHANTPAHANKHPKPHQHLDNKQLLHENEQFQNIIARRKLKVVKVDRRPRRKSM